MIKIAVVGSRTFHRLDIIDGMLDNMKKLIPNFIIISGGAKGVDTRAQEWATNNNIEKEIILPRGMSAKQDYLYRNIEIITKADMLFIFWDGKSTGTKFVIDYATARKKPLKVIQDKIKVK